MGADKNQFMKALKEAEEYDGPSLIIGYAPCINHGLKIGQGQSQSKKNVLSMQVTGISGATIRN